ncbi:MAG TPA: TldD/PmbA family protein, partial [Ruminococcaceae bacterium]|nr:TldD/PmbA family protein [Oscillospiraceae bacterium]
MTIFRKDYYADVRVEDRFSTRVEYLNGNLKESKIRREKRAFVRVFDGEMWYYASTTDINHIDKVLEELYMVAKPNSDIENHPVVKRFQRNRAKLETFKKNSVRDISIEE